MCLNHLKQHCIKKFGGRRTEAMMSQVKSAGESEGLIYNFDTMLFGDTLGAHAVVKLAQQKGLGEILAEKLFMASVTEGRSIFDRKELRLNLLLNRLIPWSKRKVS